MREVTFTAEHRLATYGTLAPGRANAHQLEELDGIWRTGTVRGKLVEAGWGAEMGFPGLVLDPTGDEVEVYLFESADLAAHWDRLDAFEGKPYCRTQTWVETPDGRLEAFIYAIEEGFWHGGETK